MALDRASAILPPQAESGSSNGQRYGGMANMYVLKLADGSYYIGSTHNLASRIERHHKGLVRSTRNKRPFELVYFEEYETRGQAQKREYQIKKWKSREAIERLIKK